MPPVAYIAAREKTSPAWCAAFAAGCGGVLAGDATLRPGPAALFGSPKLWTLLAQARAEGRDWYYGDHGYFGRFSCYRVTRNAFQHDGRGKGDEARFRAFGIPVKDWRRSGSHILLCPPDEGFAALFGFSGAAWAANVAAELRRHTDRPIVVRSRRELRPLADDLAGCHALVTYVSNAAVEAALAGVPVFCTGQCAALTMGSRDLSRIETPPTPVGREDWAAALAANQWSLEELRRGDCWASIGMERP